MTEHAQTAKRSDPISLVIFFAVVAVLLGSTYMLAENIAAEGEAVRARIDAISRQSTTETQELRSMIAAIKAQQTGSAPTAVTAAPSAQQRAQDAGKVAEVKREQREMDEEE
jgi:Sec-independent protein translocase protein TatA